MADINKVKSSGTISIIPDALRYYDENTDRFIKVRRKIRYVRNSSYDSNNDRTISTDHLRLSFHDRDKKHLFTSRVEIVGKYYEGQQVWIWGWALPSINKSLSTIIRDVFIYGTDINVYTDQTPNDQNILIKNELLTSRSIVTDIIQVESHCALASYLSKQPMILPLADIDLAGNEYIKYNDFYAAASVDLDSEYAPERDEKDKGYHNVYYFFILDLPDV